MANSRQAQGWIADYERVVRISQEQTAAHARRGARAVWTGQALYPAVLFGRKGNIVVHLSLTDDGLLYCRYAKRHVRPRPAMRSNASGVPPEQ